MTADREKDACELLADYRVGRRGLEMRGQGRTVTLAEYGDCYNSSLDGDPKPLATARPSCGRFFLASSSS
jgi:hypothetical protein